MNSSFAIDFQNNSSSICRGTCRRASSVSSGRIKKKQKKNWESVLQLIHGHQQIFFNNYLTILYLNAMGNVVLIGGCWCECLWMGVWAGRPAALLCAALLCALSLFTGNSGPWGVVCLLLSRCRAVVCPSGRLRDNFNFLAPFVRSSGV